MTIAQAASAGIATLRRTWRVTILLASTMVGGCSAAQIVNALVPHGDFQLVADQSYGDLPRQKLDIYTPLKTDRTTPVVIFFYGGNWQTGSKRDYLFIGEALTSRGFIVVIPDYRLYPEVRYPAFLDDAAQAVAWTLRHFDEIGSDPTSVHLMGHSAGAYIAAMLALNPRWLTGDRARITSAVGLAGPYDFLPLTDPVLQTIFGTETDLARTQPITYADGTAPPMLLISGLNDTTVMPANSKRLAARIREHGGTATDKYYPAIGHIALVGAIAKPLRFIAPTLRDVVEFLRQE